jgi:hypothetical protein
MRERKLGAAGLIVASALGVGLRLLSGPVAAQEFEIKSPLVEQGNLEFEWHGAVQSRFPKGEDEEDEDDGGGGDEDEENVRQAHQLSVGYGVTDFWLPELELGLEQEKGDDLKAESIGIENTFQLLPTDSYFANLGLLFTYEASVRDNVHGLEFGPLVEMPLGPFTNTANLLFEQEFGSDRESASPAFGYAWQTLYGVTGGLSLGFEAFGEIEKFANDPPRLSQQDHRIGPVTYYETELGPFELSIGAGFLFGLTDETPDNTFKFDVELEWGGNEAEDDDDEDD